MSMRGKSRGKGEEHEIIVKRRSKKDHSAEHSGAWKVAFADFTLAMMALFMVLWIIQPPMNKTFPGFGDQETNPLVDGADGVFDATSPTPIEFDGEPLRAPKASGYDGEGAEDFADRLSADDLANEERSQPRFYGTREELEALAELMRQVAMQVDATANIEVQVVPQGLRILIKDDQQRFMFRRGSAVLAPHFHALLQRLAKVLTKVENKLIISGHTDATAYRRTSGYDNWNLSGDRALRARNVLVASGLPADSVLQVAAQADVAPLKPEEPENGANRRVEILLLTESAEALYRKLFGDKYQQVHVSAKGTSFKGGD